MDKDKNNKIIKSPFYSLEKLSEDSSIAKRGLRDLGILPQMQILLKEIEKQYFEHNYQKCIDLCDEALASEPLLSVPLRFKALCLAWLDKYEEAIIWFDKALQTELTLEIAPLEHHYENDGLVHTDIDFVIVISRKGFCLLRLGKYKEAIVCLDEALAIYPQNYINLQNKGLCLERLGQLDEALDNYEKSLILQPVNDKYYDFQGSVSHYFKIISDNDSNFFERTDKFYNSGASQIAILLWEAFLEKDKNNLETLILKARNLHKNEKYIEAMDIFSTCLKQEDKLFHIWQFRGDCYLMLGDYKNALSDYLQAIELNPIAGVAYDNTAMCFSYMGDHNKAHEFIDKAITIQEQTGQREDAAMPMTRKAQFFEFQGEMADALDQYKKTLERFPDSEYAKKKIQELS